MAEDIEFLRNWASAGARCAALRDVVNFLRDEAGRAFAAGRDEEAKATRTMAAHIDGMRDIAERALNEFIAENQRRQSYS